MGKDKEEGIVLVKNTPEYQLKRKSRKKEHQKNKNKKEAAAGKKPSKSGNLKKKSGDKKESKHRKQRKTQKKSKNGPSPGGAAPEPKKKAISAGKPPVKKKSEVKDKKHLAAVKQSKKMVQGRKVLKEKSLVKIPAPKPKPPPVEVKIKSKEELPLVTAIERAPSTTMASLSNSTQVTAKEPTKEEAYLAGQLAVLASEHRQSDPAPPPSTGEVHCSPSGVRTPPLPPCACPGAPPSQPTVPLSQPSAPSLLSAPSQLSIPSQLSAPPSQILISRQPSIHNSGYGAPAAVESQEAFRPAQIGLNVDEVLRLGALMDRYGSSEQRKYSFEWLARNRVALSRDPARTSQHLMAAVGDVECDRQLAINSLYELQKAGTLTAEEVTRLMAILETQLGPITVAQLAHLVHTEGAYYRAPTPSPSFPSPFPSNPGRYP